MHYTSSISYYSNTWYYIISWSIVFKSMHESEIVRIEVGYSLAIVARGGVIVASLERLLWQLISTWCHGWSSYSCNNMQTNRVANWRRGATIIYMLWQFATLAWVANCDEGDQRWCHAWMVAIAPWMVRYGGSTVARGTNYGAMHGPLKCHLRQP